MDVDVTAVPAPRAGHGAVRGDDVSESQERMLAIVEPDDLDEVLGDLRALGGAGRRSIGHGHRRRPAAHPRRLGTARCWPTCRRRRCTRTRRSTTGRCEPPRPPVDADRGRRPAGAGRRRAPTCSACWPTPSWVWSQYDHQLFLNTVEGPGGDATVLRLKHPATGVDTGRGPGPDDRRQPPLVRASTRGSAPRWWWPRRCSTWPASAPARWRSSTASTSATPSTPR